FALSIDQVNFSKSLVYVGDRGDERSGLPHRPPSGFPGERISPTVVLVARRPGLPENMEKMYGSFIVAVLSERTREESEAHGIVGVRDRESLWFPTELAGRQAENLAEDH